MGAKILIDGAQWVPHGDTDLTHLNADFYAFSGHKMLGPTGIGILYGKPEILDEMEPFQGGGEMIKSVSMNDATWNDIPYKFEAGTPNISGAVGLGAAAEYLQSLSMDRVAKYENELLAYLVEQLQTVEGIRLIGTAEQKASVQSFLLDDIHPHDIGTILDHQGVAVPVSYTHLTLPTSDLV